MSFKELNVDLNSLFNLSYSFDSLKLTLEGILGNQRELIGKMKEVDDKLKRVDELEKEQKVTDKRLKNIENSIGSMMNVRDSKKKDKEREKESNVQKEKDMQKELEKLKDKDREREQERQREKERERQRELEREKNAQEQAAKTEEGNKKVEEDKGGSMNDKEDSKLDPLIIEDKDKLHASGQGEVNEDKDKSQHESKKDLKEEAEDKKDDDEEGDKEEEGQDVDEEDERLYIGDDDINDLKKRVSALEKKLKLSMPKYAAKQTESDSNEELLMQRTKIDDLTKQLLETQEKLAALSSQLDEVKVKVNDFNIFDLFKDCQTEGGSLDASKLLIMNLETKLFKKIGLLEDKVKMLEEDSFKSKAEMSNVKIQNDSNTRGIGNLKESIQNIGEQIDSIGNAFSKEIADSEGKLREELGALSKKVEDNHDAVKKDINEINKKIKELESQLNAGLQTSTKQGGGSLGDNDLQYMKELFKKVNELEKQLKDLTRTFSLDGIKEDIKQLKADLANKGSLQDLFDLNEKVTSHSNSIFGLKDASEKLIEERVKLANEVNFVLKKLESLNATVLTIKSSQEDSHNSNRNNTLDISKYVEYAAFNDFLKGYGKDQEKIKREIDDLKRYLDDIAQILKTKASDGDLKNLEGFLMAKIEELRLLFSKKYADKIDTSKSIKYLDTQLKHIIEVYIKKMDKGDSWLLAKKPIGGFSCASCEAYIGELQDKHDYLAWNKYPLREAQDKAYRVGNGFSRMLNMLNLDVKNTHETEPPYESDGEVKQQRRNQDQTKRSGALPSITMNKAEGEETLNMSVDHAVNDDSHSPGDEKQPKLVKIYRKNKLTSIEIPKASR